MPHHGNATRRALLSLGGALALAAGPGRPAHATLAGAVRLLAPGPQGAPLAHWAARLAASLAQGTSGAVSFELEVLGGPDGVTAANRFATEAATDGRLLLAVPGAAARARLVGDPRAKFDPAGWLPVCASQGVAVVAGRLPLAALPGPPRLAMAGPDGFGAAALLALDMIGPGSTPLPGLTLPQAEQALREGSADGLLLLGASGVALMRAKGLHPWFVLDAAPGGRDPLLPEVPVLAELANAQVSAALLAASRAMGSAARLEAVAVLPALTSANLVAQWRAAAGRWLEEEAQGRPEGLRCLAGTEAAAPLAALAPPPEAMLAYREWLLRRLSWRAE